MSSSASRPSQRSSGNSRDRRDVLEARVGDDRVEPAERVERRVDGAALPSRVVRSAACGTPGPSSAGFRSTASTPQPSELRRSAIARPIPPAAPVTMAERSGMAGVYSRPC